MKKLTCLSLALLMLVICRPAVAIETIVLYSYHNHPPFVTGEDQGLTYELARHLTQQAQGRLQFDVKIVPRARLNALLSDWIEGRCAGRTCDSDWLVAWVNPSWGFIRGAKDPYRWQKLFDDSNSIISLKERMLDYRSPASLDGMTLLGMRGHRYVGIDERVRQGLLTRVDGNNERGNLMKLLAGRGDAALLPTSTVNYFLTRDSELAALRARFVMSPRRHQSYTRFLMMPATRDDLAGLVTSDAIGRWLASLKDNR